jgi:hypothetical protein
VLVWGLGAWPWLRALGRWLWPELTLAVGLTCWWLYGPALIPVALTAFGAAGRLLALVAALRRAGGSA